MIILGIETSCDETAAAVLTNNDERITILSNVVASSANLQSKYGGIIPEQAAREQIKSIIPVITEALMQSNLAIEQSSNLAKNSISQFLNSSIAHIDAIAVTYGPGLIGSLLVGVETAKTLALIWKKPLIPVNHLIGHFYANWIQNHLRIDNGQLTNRISNPIKPNSNVKSQMSNVPKFPCLGLLVSGGHTDLVLFTDHGKYNYLGGTRDDAAGECFDKCARLLGLPYPGGPQISKLAQTGDPTKFKLPIPMKGNKSWDFSYSGLKTAVSNIISEELRTTQKTSKSEAQTIRKSGLSDTPSLSESFRKNLASSIQETIVKSLVDKVIMAIQKYKVEQVMIAGGVAANQKLVDILQLAVNSLNQKITLHVPQPDLCTDNGAMIASAGFFIKKIIDPLKLQADPNLSL